MPSPPTLSQIFSDEFTRADNTELGADWTGGYTGRNNLQIVSNQVRSVDFDTASAETIETPIPNNQWGKILISAITDDVDHVVSTQIWLRMAAPPTVSGYNFLAVNATATGSPFFNSRIQRMDSGTEVELAAEETVVWGAGDIMLATAEGPLLRLWRAPLGDPTFSLVLEANDATYTGGRPGVACFISSGPVLGLADCQISSFQTGSINGAMRLGSNLRPNAFAPGLAR